MLKEGAVKPSCIASFPRERRGAQPCYRGSGGVPHPLLLLGRGGGKGEVRCSRCVCSSTSTARVSSMLKKGSEGGRSPPTGGLGVSPSPLFRWGRGGGAKFAFQHPAKGWGRSSWARFRPAGS